MSTSARVGATTSMQLRAGMVAVLGPGTVTDRLAALGYSRAGDIDFDASKVALMNGHGPLLFAACSA